MDSPTEPVEAFIKQPVMVAPPAEAPAQDRSFDARKAVNYSVANLGASVMYALFNTGIPLYLESYNTPLPLIGLLANERSFVGAIIQPIVGRLSDQTRSPLGRRRPFFLVGIPLTSVALLLLALHPPFWLMLGVMAVAAFFLSIAWDPYMAMLADLFPPSQRGRVGGLVGVGSGLGNIIFAVLALMLWSSNEFLVFLLTILALFVCFGYTFFTVKEPPIIEEVTDQRKANVKPNVAQYIRDLRGYPEAAKYVLFTTLYWIGTGGAVPYITLFGTHVLHATDSETFILPLAATVTMALAALPWGLLADRIGKKIVLTLGLVIFGLAGIVGSQSQNMLQGVIALALIGVGNAAMNSLITPMLTDLIPKKRMAEFVGLGSAVFSFAQPLGAVIVGSIVELAKNFAGQDNAYRWAFVCAGTMVLLAGILLQTVKPERAVYE